MNVARLPEARDAIIDGSFQQFACESCGQDAPAFVPFAYVDFDRGHLVDVRSPLEESEWPRLEREPADAFDRYLGRDAPQLPRAIGAGMLVRIVFGLSPLREKLVAWDLGLADAALEALKLRLMVEHGDVTPEARLRLVGLAGDRLVFASEARDHRGVPAVVREVDLTLYEAVRDDPTVRDEIVALLDAPYCDVGRLLADPV